MGSFKFALKTLSSNSKSSICYLCSMIFPIAVIFNLLNINCNPEFISKNLDGKSLCAGIIFILSIFVYVFTFYSNSHFVASTSKELAVASLSGIHPSKLGRILLIQNTAIELIASFFGITLGFITMPIFLKVMYISLNSSGNLFSLSKVALISILFILLLQLSWVSVGDYAYVSTREINDLANTEKKAHIKSSKIPPIIFFILYLISVSFPILALLRKDRADLFNGIANPIYWLCIYGLIKYYLPFKIQKLKTYKYNNSKITLISLGNLLFSLKNIASLMLITEFFIDFLLSYAISASDTQLKVISIFSYVLLLILISSSIVYKFIMDIPTKVRTFKQLSLIGYTKSQLNKIINKEVFLFYSIITLIPLIHICTFLCGSAFNTLSLSLICVFISAFSISGFISFVLYKKSIFKSNDLPLNKFAQ